MNEQNTSKELLGKDRNKSVPPKSKGVTSKINRFLKKRPYISKSITFIFGFVVSLIFTHGTIYVLHFGFFTFSEYQQADFEGFFQDNFKVNSKYSYLDGSSLNVSIKNNWIYSNKVKTWMDVPEFVDVECVVLDPVNKGDACSKYTINSGSLQELRFNLTIGDTPTNKHRFCIYTERTDKLLRFIHNRAKSCKDVVINKD